MTLSEQLFWGSIYLGVCFLLEIVALTVCTLLLRRWSGWLENSNAVIGVAGPVCISLFFIVATHTVQVWIWAVVWVVGSVLPDWNSALYFSLVTFTTLGYGDIVLDDGLRIFAAFASVTGLLAFGLSTAYMVALMGRIFKDELEG